MVRGRVLFWVFLGVVEAVFGPLLCCGVDIVQCLLKYVIWWGTRPQRQRTKLFFQKQNEENICYIHVDRLIEALSLQCHVRHVHGMII